MKISVIRLAFAMARELRKRDIVSVALTPGFLRSERVLEHFGVTEANWKDYAQKKNGNVNSKDQNDSPQDFLVSESPRYVGRAVVALAADPRVKKKSGRVFSSWALAREYGFTDLDGTQPHWGNHARKKYGKYKICDEPILFLLGSRPGRADFPRLVRSRLARPGPFCGLTYAPNPACVLHS